MCYTSICLNRNRLSLYNLISFKLNLKIENIYPSEEDLRCQLYYMHMDKIIIKQLRKTLLKAVFKEDNVSFTQHSVRKVLYLKANLKHPLVENWLQKVKALFLKFYNSIAIKQVTITWAKKKSRLGRLFFPNDPHHQTEQFLKKKSLLFINSHSPKYICIQICKYNIIDA